MDIIRNGRLSQETSSIDNEPLTIEERQQRLRARPNMNLQSAAISPNSLEKFNSLLARVVK